MMRKRQPSLIYLLAAASAFHFCVHPTNAQAADVSMKIGRTRQTLGRLTVKEPINLGEAIAVIGGISEREFILVIRNGIFHVLNEVAMRAGALNLALKDGDEVSLLGPGHTLESLKERHKEIVVGLDALRKLSEANAK